MLELRLAEGRVLKWILQAMKSHVTDANFNFTAAELWLYEPVNSGHGRVSLCLPSGCFERYRCDRNFAMRMNINNMLKMFSFVGEEYTLTLKVEDGGEFVTFMFEDNSPFQARTADFEMKLINVDFNYEGMGEIDFDAVVRMPSNDFSRICTALSEIGDTVEISVWRRDCVEFSTTGDTVSGSIIRTQTAKGCWPEYATEIEMKRPISLALDASYLKSNPLGVSGSSQVIIGMSSRQHLALVAYKVANSGYLRFYFPTKEIEAERNKLRWSRFSSLQTLGIT